MRLLFYHQRHGQLLRGCASQSPALIDAAMEGNIPGSLRFSPPGSIMMQTPADTGPAGAIGVVMMSPLLETELPPELIPYKSRIEATIKPFIEITARLEENLMPWQSKFAGVPYLPGDAEYPLDSRGQPMFLLAQINFAETPKLEGFPGQGILQFYIRADELYGANLEDGTAQEGFRIVYFPEVIKEEAWLKTVPASPADPLMVPLQRSCSLEFKLKHAPMPAVDHQFERVILGLDVRPWELGDDLMAACGQYEKLFPSSGHKIGGYPYFTQWDPRYDQKYRDANYVLLFQMDSDGDADILWGDVGVGNFFIRERDLKKRDFSNVLYSWDCS